MVEEADTFRDLIRRRSRAGMSEADGTASGAFPLEVSRVSYHYRFIKLRPQHVFTPVQYIAERGGPFEEAKSLSSVLGLCQL